MTLGEIANLRPEYLGERRPLNRVYLLPEAYGQLNGDPEKVCNARELEDVYFKPRNDQKDAQHF